MITRRQALRIARPRKFLPASAVFITALLLAAAVSAQTMYVRPQAEVTLRRGQGNDFKILAMVRDGEKVTLLEEGQEGWTKVQTENGKEGWVLARFLSDEPPLDDLVKALQIDKEQAITELENQQAQISELTARSADLEKQLTECRDEKQNVALSLSNLQQDTANVVELRETLSRTEQERKELSERVTALERQNKILKQDGAVTWFLVGGGVLFFGWLLGLLSRKPSKRRSSLL